MGTVECRNLKIVAIVITAKLWYTGVRAKDSTTECDAVFDIDPILTQPCVKMVGMNVKGT